MNKISQDDIENYVNLYKSAFGVKPRGVVFTGMTAAEFEAEMKSVIAANEREMEREREELGRAMLDFEVRIDRLREQFNIDRPTAIRWDMQAMDVDPRHTDHYLYLNGLPETYQLVKEGSPLS